jgi:hypothetical protein
MQLGIGLAFSLQQGMGMKMPSQLVLPMVFLKAQPY